MARTSERNKKIKELIRLANKQGHLTYANINDTLPEDVVSAEEIDSIIKLVNAGLLKKETAQQEVEKLLNR